MPVVAVDDFAKKSAGLDWPYTHASAVTKSDTDDVGTHMTRAIYVGVAGDVVAIMAGGETVTFKAMPVGLHRIRVSRIKAATAATDIIALW